MAGSRHLSHEWTRRPRCGWILDGTYELLNAVAAALNQPRADYVEHLQTLWSGYGRLFRVRLGTDTAIVKWIAPPGIPRHPRGFGGRFHTSESCALIRWSGASMRSGATGPAPLVACRGGLLRSAWTTHLFWCSKTSIQQAFPLELVTYLAGIHAALRWLAAFHALFLS